MQDGLVIEKIKDIVVLSSDALELGKKKFDEPIIALSHNIS